ncbi:SDR family NAD(P)-dependent oxidoreductase [Nocardia sp. NBC_00403]|uniref:SDR family NAD(P)-dependent oxidoreductase n=1 Tax=Nocardia sp. NBC_00403 TaxID=2975990 RepID=UPI002E231B6D
MHSTIDTARPGRRAKLRAGLENGFEVLRHGRLRGGNEPLPFDIAEQRAMYRLRRYQPPESAAGSNPPVVLMIPTLMLSADLYDLDAHHGAVATLRQAGVHPWVIDFGSPAEEEHGWQRTIADHVIAVSDAIATVHRDTGRDVHLLGFSQGGMFAYQAAAYRRGTHVASIITCGSPVDTETSALPFGLPPEIMANAADFLADNVIGRMRITEGMLRTWFKMLDPMNTVRRRRAFLRQLHDREALLPDERRRRFLAKDGWVGYPGPAAADLVREFIGRNRLLSGSIVIGDRLATLAEITCPILAFAGKYDTIATPAAVRAVGRAAPKAAAYEVCAVASHFGLVAGSGATGVTWPTTARWITWLENGGPRPELVQEIEGAQPASDAEGRPQAPAGALADRQVLITGATSGIGRAAALAVAAEGGTVLLIGRRGPELTQVVEDIRTGGGSAYGYQCDITDAEATGQIVEQILGNHGHVDMLVNNAGRSIRRSLGQSTDRLHDFERTMAVNYFGALRLTLALLPQMRERKFGHIVNISTGAVQVSAPRFAAYLASKAALNKFTDVAAAETSSDCVTFTTIHLPLVRTPMIAPGDYRAFKVRTPEWAAGLIVKALVKRPKRIVMTKAALWEAWGLIAPRHKDRVMHQRYLATAER